MNGDVARVKGWYFLVTGLGPLVSIGTFQRVTGPKVDLWLVNTVGMVVADMDGATWVRRDAKPSWRFPPCSLTFKGNPPRVLDPHETAGVCRRCLGWRGGHRPPSPWAVLDIRVVGLGGIAIVPVDGR